jgi:type I restriction enzyme S subunit
VSFKEFNPYPKYKDSGIEWLGEVPEHWEVKRLKYSATINDEALPETTDPALELTYVDISSVDAIEGIVANEEMIFENAPSRARRIVRDGDTIVSTVRTYLGAIAPIRSPRSNTIVSTGFAVVRPRNVKPSFMSYALRESGFVEAIVTRSVGVSYPAINPSEIGNIPFELPPSDEQLSIVSFLDRETSRIDTLIFEKERLIILLQEYRQALISHAVTKGLDPNVRMKDSSIEWLGEVPAHWEVKRLKFLGQAIIGLTYDPSEVADEGDGILVLRSSNVQGGQIVFDDNVFVRKAVPEKILTKLGDILICSRNGSRALIGKNAVINDDSVGFTFGAFMTIFGNVLNCVQKVLEIKKGHGKKVCVDQNTDLHPLGGNHDPWQEV